MPKKYKLLTPCAEYPIGTEARQENSNRGYYEIWSPNGDTWDNVVRPIQIEGNPVWQEIVEEPEKKIVERWRGEGGQYYYAMDWKDLEKCSTANTALYDNGNYFRTSQVATRARQRTEIMCRLMGLAETIEEGSTEMKGGYMLVSNDGSLYITHSYITYMSSMRLATFSTKELAQLFLDSAGQDAIDWYGAVK